MYRDHFGFKENPFSIAPDPRYLYMSEKHKEALAHLLYGVQSEGGFVLLTGEVGTGKTTVCRCLLQLLPKTTDVAFIFNPKLTARELLSTICDELHIGHDPTVNTVKAYVDLINAHLLDAYANGRTTLLIIDEAQNLSRGVLEQIRLLTNLETNQRKLLQIILIGQPELLDTLAEPKLRQLSQRIIARYHLGPLSRAEVGAYVTHRLAVAGAKTRVLPDHLIVRLHKLSGGIPRLINTICDRALLGTYAHAKDMVDMRTLEMASREVLGDPGLRRKSLSERVQWVAAGVLLLAAFGFFFATIQLKNRASPPEIGASGDTGLQSGTTVQRKPIPTSRMTPNNDTQAGFTQGNPSPDSAMAPSNILGGTAPGARKEIIPGETFRQELPGHSGGEGSRVRPGSIKRLETHFMFRDISLAYQDLFRLWRIDTKPEDHPSACARAEAYKLQCLSTQGDISELRSLNLPALLKFRDSLGNPTYALLTRLEEKTATFSRGPESLTVSLEELAAAWKGEYTLLWKTPPDYQRTVKGGDSSPFVSWVHSSLARLHGKDPPPGRSPVFDEELLEQVKQFQRNKGLVVDGILGPKTIISLMGETSADLPLLKRKKDG